MSSPLSIAGLNDAFRASFNGGQVVITPGITALGSGLACTVIGLVRGFDSFTPDNDPYGEHDFGSINHPAAGRIFWKIDYYDSTMEGGSEDPADPSKTSRVLTIMLASEY